MPEDFRTGHRHDYRVLLQRWEPQLGRYGPLTATADAASFEPAWARVQRCLKDVKLLPDGEEPVPEPKVASPTRPSATRPSPTRPSATRPSVWGDWRAWLKERLPIAQKNRLTRSFTGLAFRYYSSSAGSTTTVIEGEFLDNHSLHYTILVYNSGFTRAVSVQGLLRGDEALRLHRDLFEQELPRDYKSGYLTHGHSTFEVWRDGHHHQATANDPQRQADWARVGSCLSKLGLFGRANVLSDRFPAGPLWQ